VPRRDASGQADLLIFMEPAATATLSADPSIVISKSPVAAL
jgi:hypothetical protein